MASIGTMIEQLDGLRDTTDLTKWESDFVTSILDRYMATKKTTLSLSAKQVEV